MGVENEQVQEYDLDLGAAEAASALGGFDPVPSDQYLARVNVKELGVSKGGYPQVVQEWQIIEGEYTGRTVREWVVFGPRSAPFIRARFDGIQLGLPVGSMKAVALAAYYAREAQGRIARITVSQEDRGDRTYNNVIRIEPTEDAGTLVATTSGRGTVSASELAEDVPF